MATAKIVITGEDRSQGAFASATKNATGFEKQLKTLVGGFAAIAGGAAIKGAISSVLDFGDRVGKLSLRLNASTEALSEYRHIATLTGVSFDSLATAWQRQTRRISEAAQGTGAAKDALKELGLEAQALARLAPEEQFERLADAFANVKEQGDKVRLAVKIWDTEGASLLQTIEGGSAALRGMRAEAVSFGLSISDVAANNIQAANDAVARLQARFAGITTTIVGQAAPGLEFFADILQIVADRIVATGQLIGGLAATIVSFVSGEFVQAWTTAKLTVEDFGDSVVKNVDTVAAAWNRMMDRTRVAAESAQAAATTIKQAAVEIAPVANSFDAVAASADKAAKSIVDAVFGTERIRDTSREAAPAIERMATSLSSVSSAARSAASDLAPIAGAANAAANAGTGGAGLNKTTVAAPAANRWIFILGAQRTLVENGRFVYRLKPNDDASQVLQGIYATGTSRVPNDGLARVEAGERIVSNSTTVNINFPGVPTNAGEFRQWVRGVLVPELRTAYR